MKKINFEDGQLVKSGYVEIEGVQHNITEAVYEGETPLSSFNLNKMQDNIEEAIIDTPATQEADGLMSKEDKVRLDNYVGGVTGDTLPIGSIIEWATDVIPTNWLLCNGQAVSRTTYAELFSAIGVMYGAGDGSTTFNLPNYKGKVTVGKDENDIDFKSIGKTGGEKTHTLTEGEMPEHYHRGLYYDNFNKGLTMNAGGGNGFNLTYGTTPTNYAEIDTGIRGGNQPHNNLQPYITTNYIIKAYQTAGVVAEVVQEKETASKTNVYSANATAELIKASILATKPVELYSGITDAVTITLNDNISNYQYVEVIYCLGNTSGNANSSKSTVGKTINLSGAMAGYFDSYYAIRIFAASCSISGTTLTKSTGYVQDLKTDGTMKFSDTINQVYITKVIGYKN